MKKIRYLIVLILPFAAQTQVPNPPLGKPSEIVITPYKTTMFANGIDEALVKISLIDKQGNEIINANQAICFTIVGDAKIISIKKGNNIVRKEDKILAANLVNGQVWIRLQAGTNRGIIKFKASADSLIAGSTEIHTIQPGLPHAVTTATQKETPIIITDKIIGADISFLPQLESSGMVFSNATGQQTDVLKILKDNGFNYIRLRIFNHPENVDGYSPKVGFCNLEHTLQMSKRVKAAGMKLLLDFHYSDTWADPQKQFAPESWNKLDFNTLKDSLFVYTKNVMQALKDQNTQPDMVQIGNEINHGMVWPNAAINNLDSLASLIYEGIKGVKAINRATPIMLHIALGGQIEEARFFVDNMLKRNVPFDVIGLSYYPKWHGTLPDLQNSMATLAKEYKKYVMVAEYSQLKKEVNDIAFTAPGNKALGTFIWEPLNTWEAFFDKSGKANTLLSIYPEIAKKYNIH